MDRMHRIKGMMNEECGMMNGNRRVAFNSSFSTPHSSLALILCILSILV
jgi:hypothetical protein